MTSSADASLGRDPATESVVPEATPAAQVIFGAQLDMARRFAVRLAGIGTAHGHLGPREVPRIWDRHLANSAVVTDLLPEGAAVIDVGSGAGLPGVAMAIRRPDLSLVLVEPMLRRSEFLLDSIEDLGLADRVSVIRGRAEEPAVRAQVAGAEWVTARAVAPLDRLAGWCLPLLRPGGRLLALKGSGAMDEAAEFRSRHGRLPVATVDVVTLGDAYELETTQVVVVARAPATGSRRRRTQ